jgi:hypothetical protein
MKTKTESLLIWFLVAAAVILIFLPQREGIDDTLCSMRVAQAEKKLADVQEQIQKGKDEMNKAQGSINMKI